MNIIKLAVFSGLLFTMTLSAQVNETKWSVEVNTGMNNAIAPFSDGYSASDERKFFNPKINHFDVGVRYMLTSRFGFKLDFANDKISNSSGSGSLPFETQQYRLGLQGVINAGEILAFDEFTSTIGLLIHGGAQVSTLTPKTGVNKDQAEKNGGIMFGITPQVKLFSKLALTLDFTVITNLRQNFAWDGTSSAKSNSMNGQMYNSSIGLTYFFGGN